MFQPGLSPHQSNQHSIKPGLHCVYTENQISETCTINGMHAFSLTPDYQLPYIPHYASAGTNTLQANNKSNCLNDSASESFVLQHPSVEFTCRDCLNSFKCQCQLKLHELLQHAPVRKPSVFACHLCNKRFARDAAFKGHLQFHEQNDQVCPRCPRLWSQTKKTDEQTIPMPSNQYRCRLCGTDNNSVGELSSHYRLKHPKKQTTDSPRSELVTDQRGKAELSSQEADAGERSCKLRSSRRIKDVVLAISNKKRPIPMFTIPEQSCVNFDVTDKIEKVAITKKRHVFVCTICKKKMSAFTSAKTHVFTHFGVKPFSCPICAKSFTQKSSVETHMAIHNANKQLNCQFCGKKFTFKVNLDSHLMKCHKESKVESAIAKNAHPTSYSFVVPYKSLSFVRFVEDVPLFFLFAHFTNRRYPCRYCFRTFTSRSSLHVHQLLHLPSSSYAQMISERYKQRIHADETTKCHHCFKVFDNTLTASRHLRHHRWRRRCQLTTVSHFTGQFFNNASGTGSCPCCSKIYSGPRCAKLHFVSHFLAEAFCCPRCPRRFTSALLCHFHTKRKHPFKKSPIGVILRYDIPTSIQRCIAKSQTPAIRKSLTSSECENITVESVARKKTPYQQLEEAPNAPVEIIQLNEIPIEVPATSFTEQLGQELVWLTASEMQDPSGAVYMLPQQEAHQDVFDPEIHAGDIFLLPQGEVIEEQYSLNNPNIFYGDPVNFVEVPVYENAFQSPDLGAETLNGEGDTVMLPATKTAERADAALPLPGFEVAVNLPELFGCSQCTERFTSGPILVNHSLSHATTARYCVCMACGGVSSRPDAMELCGEVICDTCGRADAFQQMDAILVEDEAVVATRFYCTHCNLVFGEIEPLESHVADITSYQFRASEEALKPPVPPKPKRRPNAQRPNRIQLPEQDVQEIVETQPPKDASLSERMLYVAACERGVRSYPCIPSAPGDDLKLLDGKERPHVCTVCSFRFQRSSDLHRHMFLHTGHRPYGCKFCDRRFILPRRMLAHAARAHGEVGATWATEFFSSRPRSRRFTSNNPNINTSNSSSLSFTCHVCRAVFKSASSLRQHVRIHTDTRIYACSNCSATFRTPVQRKRHMDGCHREHIVDLDSLPSHFNEEHPSPYKELVSSSKTATTNQKYIRIEEGAVETANGYTSFWQCKKCGVSFASSREFYRHSCFEENRTLDQLEPTRTVVNLPRLTEAKEHACPICDKLFPRATELRRHARVHSGEKPYSCEICGASFTQSGSLKLHTETHEVSGVERRQFKCRVCLAVFRHRNNLTRHMKQAHP